MAKYVYIYHSTNITPPSSDVMQAWGEWYQSLGNKVIDGGSPLGGPNKGVVRNGTIKQEADSVLGYAVIDASDLNEAMEMAKGNPLANAENCEVRVYEAGQM